MCPLAWGVDSPTLYIVFTLDMWPKTRGVRSMIEVKVNTAGLSFFGGLWCCGSVVASALQFTTTTYHTSPTIMQRINLLQDDPPPLISQSRNMTLASSEPVGVTNAAMNCCASLRSSQQILGWWVGRTHIKWVLVHQCYILLLLFIPPNEISQIPEQIHSNNTT